MNTVSERRRSQIVVIAALLVGSLIALSAFFYVRGRNLMDLRLREELRVMATLAAAQFNASDVEAIRGPKSMEMEVFHSTVDRLKAIRDETPSIRFAYIMRRTSTPLALEFVADADSLASNKELDSDDDGVIEEQEEGSYAGDIYDITDVPALQGPAFEAPTVDEEFTVDKWGTLISGYAPIRDSSGKAVAILGIDMSAEDYLALCNQFFSHFAFLAVAIFALGLAGVAAHFLWRRQSSEWKMIDAERSGLLQIASHRLGGPLTVFQWSSEFLSDALAGGECADIRQTVKEHLGHMHEGIAQLSSVLRELKEASDVESGNLAYRRELTALDDVIHHVVHELQPAWERRSQHVHLHLDGKLKLPFDPTLIGGVLSELLQNAILFSPDGAHITVVAKRLGKRAFIEISDHGCGIEESDLHRIFQKFVRGEKAHLHHPNGSGLGLYIAKGIIDRAGGEIRIRSEPGKGTSVTFTLPC